MEPSNYHFHHLILKLVLSTLSSLSLLSSSASLYLSILIYIIYVFMCHFQGWRQTQSAREPLADTYQCHLWQLVISEHFVLPESIKEHKTLFSACYGSLFRFMKKMVENFSKTGLWPPCNRQVLVKVLILRF